jgi:hypothetical protein
MWDATERKQTKSFSSSLSVQTISEVHPNSYPMSKGVLSRGKVRPVCEADHSTPSSAEAKNE